MIQYSPDLDSVFTAVADSTRRGILERLGRREASISELAEQFEMTLTGMKKHVRVLEDAGLVRTQKVGRVRTCMTSAAGPNAGTATRMKKYDPPQRVASPRRSARSIGVMRRPVHVQVRWNDRRCLDL